MMYLKNIKHYLLNLRIEKNQSNRYLRIVIL
jgi:hypothetical protein